MILRNVWFYFWLLFATLIFALIAIAFSWQKSGRVPTWCGHNWSRTLLWAAGVTWTADLSTLPEPPDPARGDKGFIFMVNHMSQADILILYIFLKPYNPVFIAKESLFSVPLFGRAMSAAGHIPIDRANQRKAMRSIEEAGRALDAGRSVIIFPEGTRNLDTGALADFKIGGMVLALKCGRPVYPMLLLGTLDILPKGRMFLRSGPKKVRIQALPPMDTTDYTVKDRTRFKEELYTRMNTAFTELI